MCLCYCCVICTSTCCVCVCVSLCICVYKCLMIRNKLQGNNDIYCNLIEISYSLSDQLNNDFRAIFRFVSDVFPIHLKKDVERMRVFVCLCVARVSANWTSFVCRLNYFEFQNQARLCRCISIFDAQRFLVKVSRYCYHGYSPRLCPWMLSR